MLTYLLRRIAYAVPILIGINAITFVLFFFVNSPDDMARTILGDRRVDQERIDEWKREHGYHLPRLYNAEAQGLGKLTQTLLWKKTIPLFYFDFGNSDMTQAPIGKEMRRRMIPSLYLTLPVFLIPVFVTIFIAMGVAFYRGTYIDYAVLILCVLLMSISALFYIIGGQALIGKYLRLAPVSGFEYGLRSARFLALPVVIGIVSGLGGSIRYYRTIFLEEINKDYVRTARAKGLGEGMVLYKHALRNALLPILTSVVTAIPFLITGSLLLESFFGIPGLGSYTIDAIHAQDFAIVRSMVYLGSVLFIVGLIGVDISYTIADPRVRLK